MTDKEKIIKKLKEALDSLDITNKYRLNLIRAIEYLQDEPVSEELEIAANEWDAKGFIKIADSVCAWCYYRNEKTCSTCPVRMTIDTMNKNSNK